MLFSLYFRTTYMKLIQFIFHNRSYSTSYNLFSRFERFWVERVFASLAFSAGMFAMFAISSVYHAFSLVNSILHHRRLRYSWFALRFVVASRSFLTLFAQLFSIVLLFCDFKNVFYSSTPLYSTPHGTCLLQNFISPQL